MLNSLGSGSKLARVFIESFLSVGFRWLVYPFRSGWGSDTLWAGLALAPDGAACAMCVAAAIVENPRRLTIVFRFELTINFQIS
jgi:hypothetical protein